MTLSILILLFCKLAGSATVYGFKDVQNIAKDAGQKQRGTQMAEKKLMLQYYLMI